MPHDDPYRSSYDSTPPPSVLSAMARWAAVPLWLRVAAGLLGAASALTTSAVIEARREKPTLIVPARITFLDREHEYVGQCSAGKYGGTQPCPKVLTWAVHFVVSEQNVRMPSSRFQVERLRHWGCYWVRATAETPPTVTAILSDAPSAACP